MSDRKKPTNLRDYWDSRNGRIVVMQVPNHVHLLRKNIFPESVLKGNDRR